VFDISIAPQLVSWGYLPRPPGVDLRRYRGSSLADLDICGDAAVCQRRSLLLDLGGIAKGYAVDCAIGALREAGAACGLVNAGGDLRVFGAIEAPVALRAPDWSGVIETRRVRGRALASSSNADRRRRGGARSPHVGRGRKPALSDELAVVEAPSAMLADALTKVVLADVDLARALAPRLDARVWLLSAHSRRAPA
jgi:thiamine biosynthesis lipoprotein